MSEFITFEGGEGCGKSTQLRLTADWLKTTFPSQNVVTTKEPGGTNVSPVFREMLLIENCNKYTELLLYATDRAVHVEKFLKPTLQQENTIVLCDRYTDSTIAYQSYGRGISRLGNPSY